MAALSETSWRFETTEERPLGKTRKGFTHFAEGDVLFAKITPCMENGNAAVAMNLINGLGCGTTELHVMRPLGAIESKFLFHFVHQESFREEAARNFTGTAGQLRVPLSFIKAAEIPLPPLNEQRRIVAKLEKVLSRVNAAQERHAVSLRPSPGSSNDFARRSAAAYSGSLIEDLKSGEWPHVLLDEISRELITGPFGSALHKSDYVQAGIPVINPINIVNGKIFPSQNTAVSKSTMNRLSRVRQENHDIVLARRGELGRCALVRATEVGWLCGAGSAILRAGTSKTCSAGIHSNRYLFAKCSFLPERWRCRNDHG